MPKHTLAAAIAALAAGCSWIPLDSGWRLAESGYSLETAPYKEEFAFRVHVNELKRLGGDVKSAAFQHYVAERLKWHGLCPGGWERQLCAHDDACTQRTDHAVTVFGRCLAP
jgi:hypothetical protein